MKSIVSPLFSFALVRTLLITLTLAIVFLAVDIAGRTLLRMCDFDRVLSDILEEPARKDGQSEFNVEDDKEHTEKAAPNAHFHKFPGIRDNGWREEYRSGSCDQLLTKRHVFEDRLIGKPSELFEQCEANKQGLIAIDDPASHATNIVKKRNHLESPIVTGKLMHESSGLNREIQVHLVQSPNGLGRQDRIGMQKKQPLAARLHRPSIHL